MDSSTTVPALDGLRIVELSAFVAVPLAGMTLAQLGADVIRVDPLGGGLDYRRRPITDSGAGLYWAGLNKGKRSVTLDLRSEQGRSIVRDLVTAPGEDAGVLITNLSPRWISYDHLRRDRPDLIMVVLKGNPDGSIAVDYTVNAAAGYPAITGTGDDPVNHVLPAWDLVAGGMVVTAVLSAERRRYRTGEGSLVELSLADVAFATLGHLGQVAEVVINDDDRPRYGNYLYGSFGKDFETSDGGRVMIIALTPRHWSSLVQATGTAGAMARIEDELGLDLTDEGARFAARERIAGVLGNWFSGHTLAETAEVLDRHRICWGPYRTVRQLLEADPRVQPELNPMWADIAQPGIGTYPVPGTPLAFSGVPRSTPRPAPLLGTDTEPVLSQLLGLEDRRLEELRRMGVL
jgi:2-methylfumaryl-CoA isomerase